MKKSGLEKQVTDALYTVQDPELGISLYDLGLFYKTEIKNGMIDITMTLTTIGCPLFSLIENEIRDRLKTIDGVTGVNINLVFDPPWSMEMMSERGKAMIGI